jgi:DNA repair ATPase RecN
VHLRIDPRLATRIAEIISDWRRDEIARMLSGVEITTEARAAASERHMAYCVEPEALQGAHVAGA